MRQLLRVCVDLLLEAVRRRWFLALFLAITLTLIVIGVSLQIEVVDGVIAGSSLFGEVLFKDLILPDRVLGPLYIATAYCSFYGGAFFLAVACSDFAPELLAPGRIEHLLSLPVARWQLLFGTYLGVVLLAAAGTLYGAGGLTVLLGVKTGIWSGRLVIASLVGWVGFCTIYAAMLAVSFFIRSAAVSAATGIITLALGIVSSVRESIIAVMDPGVARIVFRWAVMPIPRLATLATASAHLASSQPVQPETLWRLIAGSLVFSVALLAIASYRFERKDF